MSPASEASSYVPGIWAGLVSSGSAMLLDLPAGSPLVTELWTLLTSRGADDALLRDLVTGLLSVPAFGVVLEREGALHALARGSAVIEVRLPDGVVEVVGTDLLTWSEQLFVGTGHPFTIRADAGGGDLPVFPAGQGVVLASQLNRGQALAIPPAPPPTVPLTKRPALPTVRPPAANAFERPDDTIQYAEPAPAPAPTLPEPVVQPEAEARRSRYAQMLRPTDTEPEAPAEPVAAAEPEPPVYRYVPPEPAVVAPPLPQATGHVSGLIDHVPWETNATPMAPPQPAAAPTPSPYQHDDDEDNLEVTSRSQPTQQVLDQVRASAGPLVLAVRCPRGHLNSPHGATCRECGLSLAEQDPVRVPRPVLGVLRLSGGDTVTLDRDVILGRSPQTTTEAGPARPHLVRLTGAIDVSRNHVSVELDGFLVLVRDLNSTNGTLVEIPGQEPQRLRVGDALPVPPGTLVTLADGVWFRYELG